MPSANNHPHCEVCHMIDMQSGQLNIFWIINYCTCVCNYTERTFCLLSSVSPPCALGPQWRVTAVCRSVNWTPGRPACFLNWPIWFGRPACCLLCGSWPRDLSPPRQQGRPEGWRMSPAHKPRPCTANTVSPPHSPARPSTIDPI